MPRRYSGRHGRGSDAKMALQPMLDECLARWSLTPDGTPLTTHTSICCRCVKQDAGHAQACHRGGGAAGR